jgi:hypothetical protein
MMTPPALALGLLLVVVLDAAPAAAQSRVPSPPPRPPVTSRRETEADRLAAMIVRTTREYVASLERMRAAYKKEADSFAEMVEVCISSLIVVVKSVVNTSTLRWRSPPSPGAC